MGDEVVKNTSAVPPEPTLSIMELIRSTVKTNLSVSGDTVKSKLIASLVDEEVKRRTDAATKVFEKIEATEAELRKIRPTPAGFTLTGGTVGEPIYTKEQVDQAKKANELLTKLTNALDKALTSGDFSKVFEVAK